MFVGYVLLYRGLNLGSGHTQGGAQGSARVSGQNLGKKPFRAVKVNVNFR